MRVSFLITYAYDMPEHLCIDKVSKHGILCLAYSAATIDFMDAYYKPSSAYIGLSSASIPW